MPVSPTKEFHVPFIHPRIINPRILLKYASPVWAALPKYLADELESTQNRCLDIIGIPRTSLPTLEERRKVATNRELERIWNDINHSNQIFTTKPNTCYSYNLRSTPGPVAIPRSTTERHASSFMARAAKLLCLWLCIFNFRSNVIVYLFFKMDE